MQDFVHQPYVLHVYMDPRQLCNFGLVVVLVHNFLELTGLLSNQGEKKYTLLFHNGSFKKKVLKYGTPRPS